MRVTFSWLFGRLISQGRLTLSLARAVINVTLPSPEIKEHEIRTLWILQGSMVVKLSILKTTCLFFHGLLVILHLQTSHLTFCLVLIYLYTLDKLCVCVMYPITSCHRLNLVEDEIFLLSIEKKTSDSFGEQTKFEQAYCSTNNKWHWPWIKKLTASECNSYAGAVSYE